MPVLTGSFVGEKELLKFKRDQTMVLMYQKNIPKIGASFKPPLLTPKSSP
jgi:hypothetical protein